MTSLLLLAVAHQQGHSLPRQEAMTKIAFLQGYWVGKQEFNTGGEPMEGEATIDIEPAVGGRFLKEKLTTKLPERDKTDTFHMITFDPQTEMYRAWWFNDTSVGPMEFEGKLEDGKLVFLLVNSEERRAQLRATYATPTEKTLVFTFEMRMGEGWQILFTSTYKRAPEKREID